MFQVIDEYCRRFTIAIADHPRYQGRRIGIYNWAASGAVWYRHFLRYLGHDTKKITWVVGGPDGPAEVRLPDPPLPNVSAAPKGSSLSDLLRAEKIDALFAPLPPKRFDATEGVIVRVFPDFRTVEQKYFAATRCYPPQHVVLLRRQFFLISSRRPSTCPSSRLGFTGPLR